MNLLKISEHVVLCAYYYYLKKEGNVQLNGRQSLYQVIRQESPLSHQTALPANNLVPVLKL